MEQQRKKIVREGGLTMFDALLLDSVAKHGSQKAFAERHGINSSSLSRWLRGTINPLNLRGNKKNKAKLEESLGYRMDYLRRLGGVSVADACEIVLDHVDSNARRLGSTEGVTE